MQESEPQRTEYRRSEDRGAGSGVALERPVKQRTNKTLAPGFLRHAGTQ